MLTINMLKTGQRIKELREKNGFTVKDLQRVFGFTRPQAIYRWQQGSTLPSVDNLVLLSALFQVTIEEILVIEDITQMKGIV